VSDRNENSVGLSADRGIPQLPTKRKSALSGVMMVITAVVAVAGAVAFVALSIQRFTAQHQASKVEAARLQKEKNSQQSGQTSDLSGEQYQIARDEAQQAAASAAQAQAASTAVGARGLAVPSGALSQQQAIPVAGNYSPGTGSVQPGSARPVRIETAQDRKLGGDVLVFGAKDNDSGAVSGPAADASATAKSTVAGLLAEVKPVTKSTNALDQQLEGSDASRSPVRKAAFLPNRTYLLKRATIIRCAMGTKVVTDYPGMTECTVSQDVYSADGSTLLIRKGAEAIGEQRTAVLQGQARVMVLWTRIDDGPVKIEMDSPTTDPLGGSGMEAYVDEHFLQRFGGAMLVSIIGDFGTAIANKAIGNTGITLSTTASTTDSMAEDVLKNTINIPPTAYTLQAAETNIFAAQDVDFSDVYDDVSVNQVKR
jgi:type IV secretion system protein VirB10